MSLCLKFGYNDVVYKLQSRRVVVDLGPCPACKGKKQISVEGYIYNCSLCGSVSQTGPTGKIRVGFYWWDVERVTLDPLLVRVCSSDEEPEYGFEVHDAYYYMIDWWSEGSLYTLEEARKIVDDRNKEVDAALRELKEKFARGECTDMIKNGYIELKIRSG